MVSSTNPPEAGDEAIASIDARLPQLRSEQKSVEGLASQPTRFEGFFDATVLRRLDVRFTASSGERTDRYYFGPDSRVIRVVSNTMAGGETPSRTIDVVEGHAIGQDADSPQAAWLIQDGGYYAKLMQQTGAVISATPINRE